MTTESAPRMKITYATLRADNETLHAAFEAGLEKARARLGGYHRNLIDGQVRDGDGTFELRSPDRPGHRRRDASPRAHVRTSATPSPPRVRRSPAGRPRRGRSAWRCCARPPSSSASARWSTAALMAIEVGKNRLEALGEVEESGRPHPLLRPDWRGERAPTTSPWTTSATPAVHTRSVLRPHGVFARHQPLQLSHGPVGRAVGGGDAGRQHRRLQAGQRRRDERRGC